MLPGYYTQENLGGRCWRQWEGNFNLLHSFFQCHHQSHIKTTRSGRHMPMYDILSPVKITSNYHRETERAKAFMRYEDQHHTSPLLSTKLHRPALTPRLVPRARLLHRLSSGLEGRLTLISAAAGSGKTTLLC